MGNDRAAAARAGRSRAAATPSALTILFALALTQAAVAAAPARIASLNLCTDSMLFELLPSARIVSVTSLSRDPNLSVFHARARRVPVNHGEVEEVLARAPDLVVTGANTTVLARQLIDRLGIEVLSLPYADDFDTYRLNLRRLAGAVGVEARAERILNALDRALAAASSQARVPLTALLLQPNGYTPGRRSLMNEILRRAGLHNLALEGGFPDGGYLSLEAVLLMQPQVVVFSARDAARPSLAEEQLDHPALRRWFAGSPARSGPRRVSVPERWWTCAGLYNRGAIAALAQSPP